jgi:hydroxymethylpyrimidine/phosphomethylpyrimidine kinase
MKQALTIAGSDSGGGAGIQADLKTFSAHGVYGTSVVTAVTAQNTREVRTALDLPVDMVQAQLDAVFDDFDIAAAKTGMLSSPAIIEAICGVLHARRFENLVVDPVMVSKSGFKLLRDDAIDALRGRLVPLCARRTPNLQEASLLAGMPVESLDDMQRAAHTIAQLGPKAVVVKGGHARFALAVDVLWIDGKISLLKPEGPVQERSVHGTGCTFSAAIAARIALGETVEDAVRNAKRYITHVIRHAHQPGQGHAVGDPFYFMGKDDWEK